jgi:hypothetical protein
MSKINLSLMKRYLSEIESHLEAVYKCKSVQAVDDDNSLMIEISKTIGLLSGISYEAALLIGDVQKLSQEEGVPEESNTVKKLTSLLGGATKKTSNNNNN